jgi:uncharacterized protein YgiM (DUF1202 family)
MNEALRTRAGLLTGTLSVVVMFLLAACQPIVDPAQLEAQQGGATPEATTEAVAEPAQAAAEPTAEATEEQSVDVGPAQATVNTRSLRVRQEPSEDSKQVASIKQGEIFDVLGISSDGSWLQLALPEVEGGQGWVSTSFLTLQGDITNIQITEVGGAVAATPEAGAEITPTVQPEEEAGATPSAQPEATSAVTSTVQPEQEAEATPTAQSEEGSAATEIIQGVAQPAPGYALVVINGNDALRVRSAPTADEDNKVGNVRNGEAYKVLEISDDGKWVRIDVPALNLENGGWVSAEFVVLGK